MEENLIEIDSLTNAEIAKQKAMQTFLMSAARAGISLQVSDLIRALSISGYDPRMYAIGLDLNEILVMTNNYLKGINLNSRPQDFIDVLSKKLDREVKMLGDDRKYFRWGHTLSDNPRAVHLALVGAVWHSDENPPSVQGEWPGEWKGCECQLLPISQEEFYSDRLTQINSRYQGKEVE
jgi:hypothetical protein